MKYRFFIISFLAVSIAVNILGGQGSTDSGGGGQHPSHITISFAEFN